MLKSSCGYAAAQTRMFQISRANPAYYLTSVAHKRLPIFQTDAVKEVVCKALDDARKSGGIMIFAYVIMPDHTHLLTDNARDIRDVLRFMNGVSAKKVIDYLKENKYESSLQKLRIQERETVISTPFTSITRTASGSPARTHLCRRSTTFT